MRKNVLVPLLLLLLFSCQDSNIEVKKDTVDTILSQLKSYHGLDQSKVLVLGTFHFGKEVLDSKNQKRIEEIINQYGYPSKKLVGKKAGKTAFHVIQHADQKTQEKYLPVCEKAVKNGDLEMKYLAVMIDQIMVGQKKPQIYGTQSAINPVTYEKYIVEPIVDVKNINKRSASIGLSTIEDYAKNIKATYQIIPQKLSNSDFRRFLGGWELVNIRNAETFEIVFQTDKILWIEFNRNARMRYNREVSRCEIPYQAEANGKLRLSQLSSCNDLCCDDKEIKKVLNYHLVNRFEMFNNTLYLMDTKNQIWEFKKRGMAKKRRVQGN